MIRMRRSEQGFTLVEILVAAAILGIIGMGATRLFVNAFGVQHKTAQEFDLQQAAAEVLAEMGRGFRSGGGTYPGVFGATNVEVFPAANRIVLSTDAATVVYQWNEAAKTLTRSIDGGASAELLTGVEDFRVSCIGLTTEQPNLIGLELVLVGKGSPQPRVSFEQSLRPRVAELECH